MSARRSIEQLSERDRQILKDVIATHILNGEPVSSRAVVKQGRHGLSAASIRNIMADLEDWGFLFQPHTSAGRVPTAEGYHFFIDSLMDARTLTEHERRYIDESLQRSGSDADQLLSATVKTLKELSHQVSVALTPAIGETVLRSIELVPISGRRVLCVIVSASGFVDNKLVETPSELSREELIWISNYLTDNYSGMTLRGIRDQLLATMGEERAQVDRLLRLTIELANQSFDDTRGEPQVLVEGATEVLDLPELADIGRVRQLFDTFSQKARLVRILNECMKGDGVRVLIGEDTALTSELGFSLVTTSYGAGDKLLGTVGIFGPARMEYPRIIPLVTYLGKALSHTLSGGLTDFKE